MTLLDQTLKSATSLSQHLKKALLPTLLPSLIKLRINTYAPYVGAGIKVTQMDLSQGRCTVVMALTALNKNIVGTQFGGSLYSMVDPFYMLMLMQGLGDDYVVWDKASTIDFIAPGKSDVTAVIALPVGEIEAIKALAKDGQPVFRDYQVDIVDREQRLVASVSKTVYIRLRQFSHSKDQANRASSSSKL